VAWRGVAPAADAVDDAGALADDGDGRGHAHVGARPAEAQHAVTAENHLLHTVRRVALPEPQTNQKSAM
jgi:hypothetical protein